MWTCKKKQKKETLQESFKIPPTDQTLTALKPNKSLTADMPMPESWKCEDIILTICWMSKTRSGMEQTIEANSTGKLRLSIWQEGSDS